MCHLVRLTSIPLLLIIMINKCYSPIDWNTPLVERKTEKHTHFAGHDLPLSPHCFWLSLFIRNSQTGYASLIRCQFAPLSNQHGLGFRMRKL